ncbi:hypothetical protein [Brevibacterium moorei]|uniref:hypothetical protein n=1 Tax=Brevibacterium moorei TaxID=2968457 RepID=UPI00211BBABD|nr:hypothetical protein [Brevibacterium sp. 68QC2CO]MCQ9384424.1 hypothetical protein [Brevibacterium sp. 68QC2CO]
MKPAALAAITCTLAIACTTADHTALKVVFAAGAIVTAVASIRAANAERKDHR